MHSGMNGMDKFGYLDRINGLDHLPFWSDEPCTNIVASEGSFFPPRVFTNSNVVYIYDKDLCRVLPLQYVRPVEKDGMFFGLCILGGANSGYVCIQESRPIYMNCRKMFTVAVAAIEIIHAMIHVRTMP